MIKPFPERPRKEKLRAEDMPALRAAIDRYPKVLYRQAFYLIMMLGLRHGEVIGLKWEYFDFDSKLLTIPVTKNGEPHVLPITSAAKRLLKSIRRVDSCPYVFPSPYNPHGHIARLDKAW